MLKTGTHTSIRYGWFLLNQTAGAPVVLLSPTPNVTGDFVQIWYLRNANTLAVDTDILDIPEAANYVMQYMKVRCYEKEAHPMTQKAIIDLQMEKEGTMKTLSGMVPDNETEIEADLTCYHEMS